MSWSIVDDLGMSDDTLAKGGRATGSFMPEGRPRWQEPDAEGVRVGTKVPDRRAALLEVLVAASIRYPAAQLRGRR